MVKECKKHSRKRCTIGNKNFLQNKFFTISRKLEKYIKTAEKDKKKNSDFGSKLGL